MYYLPLTSPDTPLLLYPHLYLYCFSFSSVRFMSFTLRSFQIFLPAFLVLTLTRLLSRRWTKVKTSFWTLPLCLRGSSCESWCSFSEPLHGWNLPRGIWHAEIEKSGLLRSALSEVGSSVGCKAGRSVLMCSEWSCLQCRRSVGKCNVRRRLYIYLNTMQTSLQWRLHITFLLLL